MISKRSAKSFGKREYVALAEVHYQIRKFLRYMESQLAKTDIRSQQYYLLLAIKGFPKGKQPTINALAERLQLHQNAVSQLVDRCRDKGLLRRSRPSPDRREVVPLLTTKGEASLQKLAPAARQELIEVGRRLAKAIKEHSMSTTTRNRPRRSR